MCTQTVFSQVELGYSFNDKAKVKKAHFNYRFEDANNTNPNMIQTRDYIYKYNKNRELIKLKKEYKDGGSRILIYDENTIYNKKIIGKTKSNEQYKHYPFGYEYFLSNDTMLPYQFKEEVTFFIQPNHDSIVMVVTKYNSSFKCNGLDVQRYHYDSVRNLISYFMTSVNDDGIHEFNDFTRWEYSDSLNVQTVYVGDRLKHQNFHYKNKMGLVYRIESFGVNKQENPNSNNSPSITSVTYENNLITSKTTVWDEYLTHKIEYEYNGVGLLTCIIETDSYYKNKPERTFVTNMDYDDRGNLIYKKKTLNESRILELMEVEITYRK
jgi:hypothetical protein